VKNEVNYEKNNRFPGFSQRASGREHRDFEVLIDP
jgi:hypothetical protein